MRARVRRLSAPSCPAASTIEDGKISDPVFRTYVWIVSHDNNAVVDLNDHGKKRRIGLGKVLEHVKELESLGHVKTGNTGGDMTIEVGGGVSAQEQLVESLKKKHAADAERASSKRAERQASRPERARPTTGQSDTITAHTLRRRWAEKWAEKWPKVICPRWIGKDLGIAKQLITILGEKDALRAVELVIDQWDSISARQRMNGHPSLERVMWLRATELPGLLSGQLIGKTRNAEAARRRSLEGSEFNEQRAKAQPNVGWGDDEDDS